MGVVKALHVTFVIIWMGSLFTVSHLLGLYKKESDEVRERLSQILFRMYHFIQLPMMLLAFTLGMILITGVDFSYKPGWFHMKMTFLMALVGADIYCGRLIQGLARDKSVLPGKGIRVLHSVAGLCLIGVIFSLYVVRDRDGAVAYRLEKKQERLVLASTASTKNPLAEIE